MSMTFTVKVFVPPKNSLLSFHDAVMVAVPAATPFTVVPLTEAMEASDVASVSEGPSVVTGVVLPISMDVAPMATLAVFLTTPEYL